MRRLSMTPVWTLSRRNRSSPSLYQFIFYDGIPLSVTRWLRLFAQAILSWTKPCCIITFYNFVAIRHFQMETVVQNKLDELSISQQQCHWSLFSQSDVRITRGKRPLYLIISSNQGATLQMMSVDATKHILKTHQGHPGFRLRLDLQAVSLSIATSLHRN